MNIKAISIEQDYQNETTRVWFDVDGRKYAIAASGPSYTLLDDEGYDLEDKKLKEHLTPHYDRIAEEYCGEDCQIEE